jgi:hypothetical protein
VGKRTVNARELIEDQQRLLKDLHGRYEQVRQQALVTNKKLIAMAATIKFTLEEIQGAGEHQALMGATYLATKIGNALAEIDKPKGISNDRSYN